MKTDIHSQKILILDFGAQYSQLIARRVREAGVYCELHPFDISESDVRAFGPRGVILSGGPESVYENPEFRAPQCIFELGVPVLGICYGMQTMAAQLGGKVEGSAQREFGYKWRFNRALRWMAGSPAALAAVSRLTARWPAPVRLIVREAGDVRRSLPPDAGEADRAAQLYRQPIDAVAAD